MPDVSHGTRWAEVPDNSTTATPAVLATQGHDLEAGKGAAGDEVPLAEEAQLLARGPGAAAGVVAGCLVPGQPISTDVG